MSEALRQAYASNNGTPLDTFEFIHSSLPGGALRFVSAFYDLTATLEDSSTVTFSKSGIGSKLPDKSTEGDHDLVLQMDNVSNNVYRQLRSAQLASRSSQEKIICKYRPFLESNLSAPSGATLKMIVTGAAITTHTAMIRVSWAAFPDTVYPRGRYFPTLYPGVKYA